MSKQKDPSEINLPWPWFVGLGVAAALFRVVPYTINLSPSASFIWNFMPIGALALFAGARMRCWCAYLVPVGVMLLADALLYKPLADRGFHAFTANTPVIYASFLLYTFLGRCLHYTKSPLWIAAGSFAGSLQFFLLTNYGVWALGHGALYPKTLEGLQTCYYMALPFFRNTLAGDFIYSGVFFGLHALAVHAAKTANETQPA
jgi:hypothetical protein